MEILEKCKELHELFNDLYDMGCICGVHTDWIQLTAETYREHFSGYPQKREKNGNYIEASCEVDGITFLALMKGE